MQGKRGSRVLFERCAMPSLLEYHIGVRRLFSPAIPLLSLLGLFLFFTCLTHAQINARAASVTSPGFGGRTVNGPPASVTSVGPRGYIPKTTIPRAPINDGHQQHRRRNGN